MKYCPNCNVMLSDDFVKDLKTGCPNCNYGGNYFPSIVGENISPLDRKTFERIEKQKEIGVDNIERYLNIIGWLRKRYQNSKSEIVLSTGTKPSTFSKLETGFFNRYIKNPSKSDIERLK